MPVLKKTPLRKCLGCGEMKDKTQLIRVVKDKEGSVCIDTTGKKAGRGAYICKSTSCFDAARKARRFEKAFSGKIEDNVFEQLKNEIESQTERGL